MRQNLKVLLVAPVLFFSAPTRADAFGADIPILLQMLSNAVSQLSQLMAIVRQGHDSLSLMQDINSGLNDAMSVFRVIKNHPDLNLYKDLKSVQTALQNIEKVYGSVPASSLSVMQRNTDVNIAEALALNHSLGENVERYDSVGESIQNRAQGSSPKGAAKLTAQGVGVMVQVMNESLRAQASGLKMQAQALANENRREKEETKQLKDAAGALSNSFKSHRSSFNTPEFK